MARGAGEGRLFEGGDCFKYLRQRGGGEGGGALFEEIRYLVIYSPRSFSGIIYHTGWGTLPDCLRCSLQVMKG